MFESNYYYQLYFLVRQGFDWNLMDDEKYACGEQCSQWDYDPDMMHRAYKKLFPEREVHDSDSEEPPDDHIERCIHCTMRTTREGFTPAQRADHDLALFIIRGAQPPNQ